MDNTVGTVSLVGAGPGAPDLISVRGIFCLRHAEVLLYDRLAGEALLKEAPADCEKINVGKRVGAHAMKQEEINALLVEKALTGKYVVRLKGGDPFVFGRGGEEVQALTEAGISYELVPGISSCIAVPELAGIPVTHREVARSFHVITGHTAKDEERDYARYAQLSGTLVFLMGIGNLKQITAGLQSGGMSASTPVSIVENGALPTQRRVDGKLADIVERAEREKIQPPAIVVVGACAGYYMRCEAGQGQKNRPYTIGVTGSAHIVEKLCGLLKAQGISCEGFSTTGICDTEILNEKQPDWSHLDWAVFTSSNGVHRFFGQLQKLHIDRRVLAGVQYAVVGAETAKTLAGYGIFADFIPTRADAGTLGRELAAQLSVGNVALFTALEADGALAQEILKNSALRVCTYPIYKLTANEDQVEAFWAGYPHLDGVVCTSAGGVALLKRVLPEGALPTFYCIGEKTRVALTEWLSGTDARILRAPDNSAQGLAELIAAERKKHEE
jgi:uroporphyrinogen III methyltransferase/synthase